MAVTAGCGWLPGARVSYRPPIFPIEFSLDSRGHVEVSLGIEWTTPLGTVGVGATLDPPAGDTVLAVIHDDEGGRRVETRFAIHDDQPLGACLDGSFIVSTAPSVLSVEALTPSSTIAVYPLTRAQRECGSGRRPTSTESAEPSTSPRPTSESPTSEPPSRGDRSSTTGPSARRDVDGWGTVRAVINGSSHRLFLADTAEKARNGLSGIEGSELGDVDGMLYVLPDPVRYDPRTGAGAFTLAGYRFATEIHFFDVHGRHIGGGPARTCSPDGSDCVPYYATLNGFPYPYSYVVEARRGTIGLLPLGAPLAYR